jgi:hypothetical protein
MTENPPAPAWTDYTPSDPGITVLELLAYSVAALIGVALVAVWWRFGRQTRGNCDARSGSC